MIDSKPGRLERLASQVAAKLLIFCATRAAKRSDWHLVNHILAAVAAGNTGRNGCMSTCAFHDLTGHQVSALVKSLTNGDFNTPAGEPIQR